MSTAIPASDQTFTRNDGPVDELTGATVVVVEDNELVLKSLVLQLCHNDF